MEWLWAVAVAVLVVPTLYLYTVGVVATRFPMLYNKRICLLIAHPDDEAMFFAPTVLALTRPETGNHVKILCLSSGDADGLGETRKRELAKSGLTLGLRKEDDVFVVEDPRFQDGMINKWDPSEIAGLLSAAFAPGLAQQKKADTAPTASIDVIITFDAGGVSQHPNHISLYHGAKAFVAALTAGRTGWAPPVDLYTLTTVPLARKYAGFLDVVATLAGWALGTDMKNKEHPKGLVFLNGAGNGGVTTAWKAMTTAHQSQMVWFRYGWITLSRYMYMNDLKLDDIKAR
ncbi:putative deacetylase LmbE-like domain-containing protein [Podospora aff. communis PSN243]|uniref:N-acetylglucosaminylphosphatidylinositol deacetylase n=1 Tax=Podospora aff. communis PSN243 TaxID=3040156 RepID=A0AAV9G4Q8_9PEZI|nr:putative deacetylase LmbE-like domain-containing protein [Podospora aff. communis PSN243]